MIKAILSIIPEILGLIGTILKYRNTPRKLAEKRIKSAIESAAKNDERLRKALYGGSDVKVALIEANLRSRLDVLLRRSATYFDTERQREEADRQRDDNPASK